MTKPSWSLPRPSARDGVRRPFETDPLVDAQCRQGQLLAEQHAQVLFQCALVRAVQAGELRLPEPERAVQVQLVIDADEALDAHVGGLGAQEVGPRPPALDPLHRAQADEVRHLPAARVPEAQVAHVGGPHPRPGDEGASPVLARDQSGVLQAVQRLLDGPHAHPMLHCELLLGRQADALAQRPRLDSPGDRLADALELGQAAASPRWWERSG